MSLNDLPESLRDAIRATARKHGVTRVRVIGSFARGEAREDSDLDLLIERGPHRTPFFPGGLVADLEELLGRRVEVVTEASLPGRIKADVLKEAIPL